VFLHRSLHICLFFVCSHGWWVPRVWELSQSWHVEMLNTQGVCWWPCLPNLLFVR
jgi:hypothetical protein